MDETPTNQDGDVNDSPGSRLRAVALQYREATELPKVVSAGADDVAAKIIALAKSQGIPVKRDQSLTEILAKIPVGAVIPDNAFQLVAQIISFLYHSDKEWRESHSKLAEVPGMAVETD